MGHLTLGTSAFSLFPCQHLSHVAELMAVHFNALGLIRYCSSDMMVCYGYSDSKHSLRASCGRAASCWLMVGSTTLPGRQGRCWLLGV